jgi:hypothetical protein
LQASGGAGEPAQHLDPLAGVTELIASGETVEARKRLAEALDFYRRKGDRQGEAFALYLLAMVDSVMGDQSAAASNLERSAAGLEAQADYFGSWVVLLSLAELHNSESQLDSAIEVHQRALALLGQAKASPQPFSSPSSARCSDGPPEPSSRSRYHPSSSNPSSCRWPR